MTSTSVTRVAAVTGGAGAIGGAIAAGLRAAGHEVVIFDLNGAPVVNLANRDAVRAGAAALLDRHGRCDVLVHAAAAFDRASLLDLDPGPGYVAALAVIGRCHAASARDGSALLAGLEAGAPS